MDDLIVTGVSVLNLGFAGWNVIGIRQNRALRRTLRGAIAATFRATGVPDTPHLAELRAKRDARAKDLHDLFADIERLPAHLAKEIKPKYDELVELNKHIAHVEEQLRRAPRWPG